MNSALASDFVKISEEGPREGFQSEPAGIPTSDKIMLIEALAEAGLSEINCCSFVSKAQVPQMADAEEIIASVKRKPQVMYTGLWLNLQGFERAQASGADLKPTLVTSASETFGLKNNKRDRSQLLDGQRVLAHAYNAAGLTSAAGYVFTDLAGDSRGISAVVEKSTQPHGMHEAEDKSALPGLRDSRRIFRIKGEVDFLVRDEVAKLIGVLRIDADIQAEGRIGFYDEGKHVVHGASVFPRLLRKRKAGKFSSGMRAIRIHLAFGVWRLAFGV